MSREVHAYWESAILKVMCSIARGQSQPCHFHHAQAHTWPPPLYTSTARAFALSAAVLGHPWHLGQAPRNTDSPDKMQEDHRKTRAVVMTAPWTFDDTAANVPLPLRNKIPLRMKTNNLLQLLPGYEALLVDKTKDGVWAWVRFACSGVALDGKVPSLPRSGTLLICCAVSNCACQPNQNRGLLAAIQRKDCR